MKLAKTPGRGPTYDWVALYEEYVKDNPKFLREWALAKKLNYTYVSKQFTELERLQEAENLRIAKRKLSRLAPKAVERIGELTDSEDENIKLKASTAIVDRVGLNPQTATISVQNVNATQINIPPMFSSENRDDLAKMLNGDEE